MQRHFEQELNGLKTNLIKMGSLAEKAVHDSLQALLNDDTNTAQRVIDGEDRINSLEIEIDNSIVDILALQQPVAIDLRFILSALKINNDLERIGDHAVNIAESVCSLAECEKETYIYLPKMAEVAEQMLHNALDSFIHSDTKLGMDVLGMDDTIDNFNKDIFIRVIERMKNNQRSIEAGMHLIRVSRNLERVADLATNIAEEVIFIAQARIVKHHSEKQK
ncbi:MAG: phosphate transport system regulatory protein PhoU [Chlorobiaceae bacterium]|nr:phosphate transport system regulatory protein PhoU [Chlorobiaceae bacterium]